MRVLRRSAAQGSTRALVCACLFVSVHKTAFAAESTMELPAGGLAYVTQQTLVTDAEDTVIAAGLVRATYVVRNSGDGAHTGLIAFALPDIDMVALDGSPVDNPAFDPQNLANYVGFTASVDGQPAETFVESRALALGLIDVTAKLRELNLSLYPLHPDLTTQLAALPDAARTELMARSLIRYNDGQWEPLWRLKTTLFWQQSFAAGQTHTVAISYRPIAGTGTWNSEAAAALQQRYCVPQPVASELATRGEGTRPPAPLKWVHYMAYSGATGRGAATAYRIAIETSPGAQTAYTCHDGLKAEAAAGGRDKSLSNFTAEEEILVLFVD